MQHDEMIWQVINNQFCSFKTTLNSALSDHRDFCRHPYSITGLCNRSTCPLANSRYATIREEGGKVHLYIKTVERAHTPKNLWEKIHLSRNYSKALSQVDEHLAYFPKAMVHRNKQRLTKIHQHLIRMRKIKLKELAGKKAKVVGINRKIDQREERREKKALVAAKIEANIEKELIERLAKGAYGDIYNFPEAPYQKALERFDEEEIENESSEEESNSEEEEMEMDEGLVEYVEDMEEDGDEEEEEMEEQESDEEDIEDYDFEEMDSEEVDDDGDDVDDDSDSDDEDSSSGDDDEVNTDPKKRKQPDPKKSGKMQSVNKGKGTRVEVEYEEEDEDLAQQDYIAGSAW